MRCDDFPPLILLILMLTFAADGQNLPETMRGYPVHRAAVSMTQSGARAGSSASDVVVTLGEPVLRDVSVTGLTFEMTATIMSLKQSGRVDFLAFHDLRVNGMPVQVAEYRFPFSFRKGKSIELPKPAVVFVPTFQVARAALREIDGSTRDWNVTGRLFVFGKFRKFGFDHKRVVPVDISLQIINPIAL